MQTMLKLFFQPYLQFLLGAAYSIQQTLEGLGLRTSWFLETDEARRVVGSYLSAQGAVSLPFVAVLAYSGLLVSAMLLAIKRFSGRTGLFVGLLVCFVPGTLSVVGAWPFLQWTPSSYLAGTGDLGSPWGMFAVLVLGLLTGWTTIALLTSTFRFGDRFRHGYDHVWYSMAIITGLLFVADLGTSRAARELQQANKISAGASAYLLQQVRRLSLHCQAGAVSAPAACSWSTRVQGVLERFEQHGEFLYAELGPATSAEIYLPRMRTVDEEAVRAIRVELANYNQIECPVRDLGNGARQSAPVSTRCQTPPPDYCSAGSEALAGQKMVGLMITPVAIASECVVPILVAQKVKQQKLVRDVRAAELARHWRWLFFVITALLAGGKVANASARLVDVTSKGGKPHASIVNETLSGYRRCRWRRSRLRAARQLTLRSQRCASAK
jgi:hypothetical protein